MNINIKKLSPQFIEDYLYFFDHRAFCNHPEWAGCYCMFYNFKASNYHGFYGMYKKFGFELKSSYEKYAVMQFQLSKGNK